jgi:SAM-dependent methyltransferase
VEQNFSKEYGDWEQWHWWFRGRRQIIRSLLLHELTLPAPRRILSVGCGPSQGLNWLVPFAGPDGEVVGLDLDPQHGKSCAKQVTFVAGKLEEAPLAGAQFDVVLALDVLEHLDDDTTGLREVIRLVKPGGLMLLTVPALPSVWGGQDVISHHRRRYTKRSLRQLLNSAQLSGYQIRYFNTLLFPLASSVRWSRRALGLGSRERSDFEDNRPGMINEALARVFSTERYLINHRIMPIGLSLAVTYRQRC